MNQQIIVTPLGLITQPNKLGTYPSGAMKTADGVFIRDPSIVEVSPYLAQSVTAANTLGSNLVLVFAGPPNFSTAGATSMLQVYSSGGAYLYAWLNGTSILGSGTLRTLDATNQNLSTLAQTTSFTSRNRQFLNCTKAVLVADHITSNPTPRNAGLVPLCTSAANGIGGVGPAYTAGNFAHYTATIRRVYSDGYELVSAPSAATCLYASGGVDTGVFVYLSSFYHRAGDIVDLYRTRSQASGTNTGADYYLCASYTLTSADITATNILLKDYCADDALGEALYTNPGIQGEGAAAGPPPQCKVMANFKGYAFYLNCTDPPEIILRVGTFLGYMGSAATGASAFIRTHGIGSRDVVCTVTSGSPTLTAISAADIVGIKVGQQVNSFRFATAVTVTAVGATTITFNGNATSSAVGTTITVYDVIEVDGRTCPLSSAENFCTLPIYAGSSGTNQADVVVQVLDRVLPLTSPITNPSTTFAEGILISRWFLADGHSSSLTVRATNGINYTPQIPEITATVRTITETTRPNGFSWSEQNQPERVCPLSTGVAGSGELYAAFATRDALWMFASDGLWRLSGTGGSAGEGYDWRVDPVDSTLIISGPQAGCVLRDTVYAYTNRGLVAIDSSGAIRELSMGRLNDIMPGPQWALPTWDFSASMWMVADETHDEIQFTINNGDVHVYVYNTITDVFTRLTVLTGQPTNIPAHAVYNRSTEKVYYMDRSPSSCLTALASSYGPHTVLYQPIYADNPFVMRHWQNVNYVLNDTSGTQAITPIVNGVSLTPITGVVMGDSGFQRMSAGVPRNSPAIANQISVGFLSATTNSTSRRLFSIAVEYVDVTDQRRKR